MSDKLKLEPNQVREIRDVIEEALLSSLPGSVTLEEYNTIRSDLGDSLIRYFITNPMQRETHKKLSENKTKDSPL